MSLEMAFTATCRGRRLRLAWERRSAWGWVHCAGALLVGAWRLRLQILTRRVTWDDLNGDR